MPALPDHLNAEGLRVDAIRLFEMEHLDLSFVPKGRVKALARYATTAFVHNLRQLTHDHRIATLLAFASTYLAVVHDDALDLFDVLMRTASSQATREGQQARLRTIHDLDAAAQVLSEACQVVLDETQDPVTLRERIYARVPVEHLQAAVTTVGELTRPPDDTYAQELLGRYLTMRRFLPTFWRTLEFESTPGDPRGPVLAAHRGTATSLPAGRTARGDPALAGSAMYCRVAPQRKMGEEAYRRVAAHLPTDTALQIEQRDGVDVPDLERLERVAEPEIL